jgi:hypothetical protein
MTFGTLRPVKGVEGGGGCFHAAPCWPPERNFESKKSVHNSSPYNKCSIFRPVEGGIINYTVIVDNFAQISIPFVFCSAPVPLPLEHDMEKEKLTSLGSVGFREGGRRKGKQSEEARRGKTFPQSIFSSSKVFLSSSGVPRLRFHKYFTGNFNNDMNLF